MKVLVTGSSGFIGAAVCRLLRSRGVDVTGLDRAAPHDVSSPHLVCDICDPSDLRRAISGVNPELIIHLAARTDLNERRSLSGYAANIDGVRNLIAAACAVPSCRRVIYTSSQLVCRPGYVPLSATDYCPHTLYGESKVCTEQIVRAEAGRAGEWCLVRPTTVWGPGMSPHYQSMLRLIVDGRYFHCGSSPLYKSYSYIDNIAWQYFKLVSASADDINGRTFYLADYEPLSLRRYADEMAARLGARPIRTYPLPMVRFAAKIGDVLNGMGWRRFPFNSFRLRNILTEYVFDLSDTRQVCGAVPVSFADGMAATAEWFQTVMRSSRAVDKD